MMRETIIMLANMHKYITHSIMEKRTVNVILDTSLAEPRSSSNGTSTIT